MLGKQVRVEVRPLAEASAKQPIGYIEPHFGTQYTVTAKLIGSTVIRSQSKIDKGWYFNLWIDEFNIPIQLRVREDEGKEGLEKVRQLLEAALMEQGQVKVKLRLIEHHIRASPQKFLSHYFMDKDSIALFLSDDTLYSQRMKPFLWLRQTKFTQLADGNFHPASTLQRA